MSLPHVIVRTGLVAAICGVAACGVLGPTCTARQMTGHVATLSGELPAGGLASHRLAYDTSGSQHDVLVGWQGQADPSGPRLRFYATRDTCKGFTPLPSSPASLECAVLGAAGAMPDGTIVSSLVVTHGRGNPEVLGAPPAFTVWVAGDTGRPVRYTLDVTWLVGPDC